MSTTPPNADEVDHHYAGVFLVTDENRIIGQLRDNKYWIDNPGKVTSFGGTVEKNEEHQAAAWRELVKEETNLTRNPGDLIHFLDDVSWRPLTEEWEVRYFYYVKVSEEEVAKLEVYEGQGWVYIEGFDDPKVAELWRAPVKSLESVINT